MQHTTKEAVSTTRRLAPHMFRLLAITIPLCLTLSLSFSLPTFAQSTQQARPTSATQAATTCDQTWIIDIPPGGIIIWFGNSEYLSNSEVKILVQLNSSTGAVCSFSLEASFTLTDPSTGNTITVSGLTPCSSPAGTFDSSTGALTLNGTLTLQNLPFTQGTVKTACGALTTEPPSITTSNGTVISGSRVDSSGNVTLVGATSFPGLITEPTQIQIVGTFKRVS